MSRGTRTRPAALRILWEYRVRPDRAREFETHYGSDGTWARFFRRARGYRGTILMRDREDPRRYMTIDVWAGADPHRRFMAAHAEEYGRIDRTCEEFTDEERCLGYFLTTKPEPASLRTIPGSSRTRGAPRRTRPSRRTKRS